MCGIAGFIGLPNQKNPYEIAKKMNNVLIHRGPDSEGIWCDPNIGLGFAHRRLAIMDLSEEGHQPMHSKNGRYVMIFNGEIYNHLELRNELKKYTSYEIKWRGHSDTETLLECISSWGFKDTLKRCNGMFAISLWDNKDKKIYLARDRSGEKPLYYGNVGNSFVFGSELKALAQFPGWRDQIDHNALSLFLKYSFIPAPYSIFQNIKKLLPGHFLCISIENLKQHNMKQYWNVSSVYKKGNLKPFAGNKFEAIEKLDNILRDAVSSRMLADVPLGAFLSGGVDSSTVVSMMQSQSSKQIKTFSIGFSEEGYNESIHAAKVASYLNTDHTELNISSNDALNVIPKLSNIWDEPFGDNSQIPTFLVSELARKDVTVSLSGDGGDELFCGYNRYTGGYRAWQRIINTPKPLRNIIDKSLSKLQKDPYSNYLSYFLTFFGKPAIGNKLEKLRNVSRFKDIKSFYNSSLSASSNINHLMENNDNQTLNKLICNDFNIEFNENRNELMFYDFITYLPDNILVKMDRASMAVSLEARVPLLDHRVIEFAASIPLKYKVQKNESKWLLKQVLYKYLPRNIIDRPKMGFSVPIDSWLRGPLKEWSRDLLDKSKIESNNLFNFKAIQQILNEHENGIKNHQQILWNILMFQSWIENWKK